jgi:hypothetical protein
MEQDKERLLFVRFRGISCFNLSEDFVSKST